MNWLDAIIVAGIIISGVSGLLAGLWKELFSFAAAIVGIVLAGRFSVALGHRLTFITDATAAQIIGFVIIFVVVMIAGAIAAGIVSRLFSKIGLWWLDRLGGLCLGVIEGIAILGFIMVMANKIPVSSVQGTINGAGAAHFVMTMFNWLAGFIPGASRIV